MAQLNIDTNELHKYGRELGFILAEFVQGFIEGIDDYKKALEAAEKAEAEKRDDTKKAE